MQKENAVTIRTIAERAGVSTATVSRVLSGAEGVTPKTRERVRQTARDLGYVPNEMARGLRKQTLPLVGIIVPDIVNEFFSRIVLKVQLALARQGYSVFICNTDESAELEIAYLNSLQAMRISGLICISGYGTPEENWPEVPTIYIDRNTCRQVPRSAMIESDNHSGGWMAAEELLRRGCRRLAILRDERDVSTAVSRQKGFFDGAARHGMASEDIVVLPVGKVDENHAYDAVSYALRQEKAFDGLFCMTDWLAMGALRALKNAHLPVPEKVRVVGFDDVSAAAYSALPLTTIRQNTDELSRIAAEELLRMMEGEPCQRKHWIVPVSLIRRETT